MAHDLSSDRGSESRSQRQEQQAADTGDGALGEQLQTQQQHPQDRRPTHVRLQQREEMEEEEDEQEHAQGGLVTEEAALGKDEGEEEEEEERERSSLFRKMRSMWLGSRQGSIFLKKKFVTFEDVSVPAEGEEEGAHPASATTPEDKAGATSGGGARTASGLRKSISGTRAAVLGSRRGSISVRPKGVKFDVGTATTEEYLESTGKTGAESGGVKGRPSMTAVMAALLGSKRGSISVRPKGVKFDVDTSTMEEYLETTKGAAAIGGGNSKCSLGAVRAALLGSKRGSISVRPKEVHFDKDTATMDEDLQAKEGTAASGGAKGRPSMSAVRAAVLGSKRGSISVRPKGVKFDVDTSTMEEYLESTKGTVATGGVKGRPSLSAVRAALLGCKRGSMSVRPKCATT